MVWIVSQIWNGEKNIRHPSYRFRWPMHRVEPKKAGLDAEGKAEFADILGDSEALYVKSILSGLDVRVEGQIPYVWTETTTTLYVPEFPKESFTYEQHLAGEDRNLETATRIVLNIDNKTGEILVSEDAPVIPDDELDKICRSLLEKLKEERHWKLHDKVWMDEVRRVSDWYYVSYRIREKPYHKGEDYWFYTFWIDSHTRMVSNGQCGILYSDR